MMTTFRNRLLTIAALTIAAAVPVAVTATAIRPAAATAATAVTAPGHPAAVTAAEQSAVIRYWTPARMAASVPTDGSHPVAAAAPAANTRNAWLTGNTGGAGLRWVHGGTVTRAVGKVFFTLGSTNYVCSGTAVSSPHAEVVLTAAHCVNDGAGHYATHWMFVPGYVDGKAPYGVYPARRFFMSSRWPSSEQYDVAFVQLSKQLPADLPVSFSSSGGGPTYVFGYPAQAPFSGFYLNYCAGRDHAVTGGSVEVACTMTAGDSGGPWLAGFRPRAGTGTVAAVSTYKLSTSTRTLYAAVLGSVAHSLYNQASA